ncbi:MAG: T9SS type A sorting domain-containing protein [Bacteroidetes bacterium]|nr:T9SS type A sorting domain-containing protein [Bacteroidota bacterium]
MKSFYLHLSFLLVFCLLFLHSFAVLHTSVANGAWNTAAIWSPATVPGSADDVVIAVGTTVTNLSGGTNFCNNLTNNGTLNLSGSLQIFGTTFTNNSSFTCTQTLTLRTGSTVTVSGSGSFTCGTFQISGNANINTPVAVTINATTVNVASAKTATNNGTVSCTNLAITGTWTNASGSSLSVKVIGGTGTLNASAISNTVSIINTSASSDVTSADLKRPASGYNILVLSSAGTKILQSNLTVTGNLTVSGPFNVNTKNMTLGGNWTQNNASLSNNTGTCTFNGGAAQTISGTIASIPFTNLTLNNASGLTPSIPITISGNNTLTSGTLTISSTLTYNGAAAQTISGAGSITCSTAGTITINNAAGVTTSSAMTIDGTITVSAGTFNTGATTITLPSDAAHTGRIGNSAGTIVGSDWRQQRFIASASANWDDFSTPINGNNLGDWDNELYLSIASGCPDGTAAGFKSVYYFDAATQAWVAVTTCAPALPATRGYELWLGSDMSNYNPAVLGTVDSRGTPNFGNKAATLASGVGNWTLIGNPYASGIDWALVFADASGLSNFFQIYDQSINNYVTTPNGGIICSTQGFWVQNSGGAPSLTFKESHKTATNVSFVRQSMYATNDMLKMKLYTLDKKNASELIVKINNEGTDYFNAAQDASYRRSKDTISPGLTAVTSDGIKTMYKTVPKKTSLSVPLSAQVYVPGTYYIDFNGINTVFGYNCISLEDKETGVIVKLTSDKTYSFTQSDISKEHLFVLHFENVCTDQTPFANTVRVYSVEDGAAVNFNFDEATSAQISVYNLLGENVANENVKTEKEIVTIPLAAKNQVYIVRVTTSNGTTAYKIFY